MLRVDGIRLLPGEGDGALRKKAAAILRVKEEEITALSLLRRSIDARGEVCFLCAAAVTVKDETRVKRSSRVSPYRPQEYVLPPRIETAERPVIAGAGPAGLFAALLLAKCGVRPILLERGKCVEERVRDVEAMRRCGVLDPASNVAFGEGGAGTFSDGKLNTGTKDLSHTFILQTLVDCGADASILTDAKPHVGTDRLFIALQNLRKMLLGLGADIRFCHTVTDLLPQDGALHALRVRAPEGDYTLPARRLVLAPGHSARDTFEMLLARGVPMEQKPFAVGVRIEHLQREMDAAQYRSFAGHPALPPSSYKLAYHTAAGRGVFSFCVCPGGEVVAAATEQGGVVTNGMSRFARDGETINGGLLVSVTPEDFPNGGVLAGVALQRELEQSAFRHGGGGFFAPAQTVGDFLAHRPSSAPGRVAPTYRPGVKWCDLHGVLPAFVCEALEEALPALGRRIRGFDAPDAVLTAVETRSSSPVRILRDETGQSALRGLYPCGEGAGYAGGIMSAAADGLRAAGQILAALSGETVPGKNKNNT